MFGDVLLNYAVCVEPENKFVFVKNMVLNEDLSTELGSVELVGILCSMRFPVSSSDLGNLLDVLLSPRNGEKESRVSDLLFAVGNDPTWEVFLQPLETPRAVLQVSLRAECRDGQQYRQSGLDNEWRDSPKARAPSASRGLCLSFHRR